MEKCYLANDNGNNNPIYVYYKTYVHISTYIHFYMLVYLCTYVYMREIYINILTAV